jgi:hypothetical protein
MRRYEDIYYFAAGPHPRRLCLRGLTPLGIAISDFPLSQR